MHHGRRHPLPAGPGPGEILEQIRAIPDIEVVAHFIRKPAYVSRDNPYVRGALRRGGRLTSGESMSVGRDGASDAGRSSRPGVPAVEFGPSGAGHHGPDEWVSISSLARYRQALGDFVRSLPALERPATEPPRHAARRRGRPRVSPTSPRVGRGCSSAACSPAS